MGRADEYEFVPERMSRPDDRAARAFVAGKRAGQLNELTITFLNDDQIKDEAKRLSAPLMRAAGMVPAGPAKTITVAPMPQPFDSEGKDGLIRDVIFAAVAFRKQGGVSAERVLYATLDALESWVRMYERQLTAVGPEPTIADRRLRGIRFDDETNGGTTT